MTGVLADQKIDVEYHRDPLGIEALDEELIVEDLARGMPETGALRRVRQLSFTDCDHLLIATDRRDGRAIGLLAAQDCKTAREEFLHLECAFVRSDARDRHLMTRMMAALVLRAAGLASAPTVIAGSTGDSEWLAAMRAFGRGFNGSACFPQPPADPVSLRSAALAQRVARSLFPSLRFDLATGVVRGAEAARWMPRSVHAAQGEQAGSMTGADQLLALIDLRTESEAGIMDDARRMHRAR